MDALAELEPDDFKAAVMALLKYGLDGEEQALTGIAKTVFVLAKKQIDDDIRRRENGKKGGKKITEPEPNSNLTLTELEPNFDKERERKQEKETEKEQEKNKEKERSKEKEIKREIERDKEKEIKKDKEIYIYSRAEQIIDHLNARCGTHFRANTQNTKSHISARLREGFTVEDFYEVIDKMAEKWLNDPKMRDYLRPQTLFGTKFESYLNAPRAKPGERSPYRADGTVDWSMV